MRYLKFTFLTVPLASFENITVISYVIDLNHSIELFRIKSKYRKYYTVII